jgi:hypothetical protein
LQKGFRPKNGALHIFIFLKVLFLDFRWQKSVLVKKLFYTKRFFFNIFLLRPLKHSFKCDKIQLQFISVKNEDF